MYEPSIYRLTDASGKAIMESEVSQDCIDTMYQIIEDARKFGEGDVDPLLFIEHSPGEWI